MKTKNKKTAVISGIYFSDQIWRRILENSTKHWGSSLLRHRNKKGFK